MNTQTRSCYGRRVRPRVDCPYVLCKLVAGLQGSSVMDTDDDQIPVQKNLSRPPSAPGSCKESESTFHSLLREPSPDPLVPGPRQCHLCALPAPADPPLRWKSLSHNNQRSCRDHSSQRSWQPLSSAASCCPSRQLHMNEAQLGQTPLEC